VSTVICFEDRCEREEERRARELEERLKQHLEDKLAEMLKALVEQYEIEVTIDIQTGKGVGKWKKKRS
jgi:hypothetical protein